MSTEIAIMRTSFALLLALASAAVSAQGTEMQRCRGMADDRARLACYDALAAGAGEAAAAASATKSGATFGLDMQLRKSEPDAIESQLTGLVEGWGPRSLFKLANGQVWQVIDGSSAVLYLKDPKVKIRRGAMGTFVLEIDGTNETARVNRLR
jgi:hypothetical protein